MSGTHCRIGKVRLKAAPHLALIVPRRRDEGVRAHFMRSAAFFARELRWDVAGYAMVVWDFDGRSTSATQLHVGSAIGPTTLPSFAAEVLRRHLIGDIAHGIIDPASDA